MFVCFLIDAHVWSRNDKEASRIGLPPHCAGDRLSRNVIVSTNRQSHQIRLSSMSPEAEAEFKPPVGAYAKRAAYGKRRTDVLDFLNQKRVNL